MSRRQVSLSRLHKQATAPRKPMTLDQLRKKKFKAGKIMIRLSNKLQRLARMKDKTRYNAFCENVRKHNPGQSSSLFGSMLQIGKIGWELAKKELDERKETYERHSRKAN